MTTKGPDPLCVHVRRSINRYLKDLNGEQPVNVYDMVIRECEKPLLQAVMQHADSNQTLAAKILGINRNTLRKKLKRYELE